MPDWKYKCHFRIRRSDDSSIITFSSVADAKTKIGFQSAWDTSSPTKSEALADSDQTLVVTYTFSSESDQTAHRNATIITDSTDIRTLFVPSVLWPNVEDHTVEPFKVEWLNPDDSVAGTTNQ